MDYADGPINALCGKYYREHNIVPKGEELIQLYREKGTTVDIEQIEWVKATLEKYK